MFRPEGHTPAPKAESQPHSPHIVSLESMKEQAELQQRLALMSYRFVHFDFAKTLDPLKPETVDVQIRDSAMMVWAEKYGGAFRNWINELDQSRTKVNLDDPQTLEFIYDQVNQIQRQAVENEEGEYSTWEDEVPPTLH